MMQIYVLTTVVIMWMSLLLRYFAGGSYHSLIATGTYFSYFSILANIFAALTLTEAALQPPEGYRRLTRPGAVTGTMLYLSVAGVLFLLNARWWTEGIWLSISSLLLHCAIPIIFFMFWLLLIPKGRLARWHPLVWLVFPFSYAVYSLLLYGSLYLFLDVGALGFDHVLVNIALLGIIFLSLGTCLVALDSALGVKWRRGRGSFTNVASAMRESYKPNALPMTKIVRGNLPQHS